RPIRSCRWRARPTGQPKQTAKSSGEGIREMSIEDRLHALAQQYGAERGSAALTDPTQLVAQLSSKAPDLHGEIRALAAAIQANAAARIAAAPNTDLEAQAIAAEIAASQKLSMTSVIPAVAVVQRLR